jgi:ABC-type branched-subunit amino acid transport system substrate-binding protein
MRNPRPSSVLALAAATLLTLSGCSSGGTSGGSDGSSFTVHIGNVLPFTGDLSTYGGSLDKAGRMGADLVNEALAKDKKSSIKISVVGSEDDQTASAAGVEAATKLVQTSKADVLVGSMSSGVTTAIAQSVAIPNDVVLVTPTSSDPSITDLSDNGLVFRIYPPDTLQARALAQVMGDAYGKTALINVGGRNDAFGSALTREFAKQWQAGGGRIGQTVLYNPTAATFDTEAAKLVSGSPSAWMIADFPTTFEKMGPALVRTGKWDPSKTFMTEAMQSADSLAKIGQPATDGLRGTAGSGKGGAAPDAFQREFESRNKGVKFTGFEGTSFDATVIAALAAIKAGSSEPDEIKKALLTVSTSTGEKFTWQQLPEAIAAIQAGKSIEYMGAWGPIVFDQSGDPTRSAFDVWSYKKDKISIVQNFSFGG